MFAANPAVATDAATLPAAGKPRKTPDPLSLWIRGYGASGDRNGDDIASRYTFTIGGTIAGIEYRPGPSVRAGAAFGYSRTDMDMKDLEDSGSEDSYQGSLYGSYTSPDRRWYVDAALGYSINRYDTKRYLNFGTITRTAKGSYDGSDISGYAESGYLLPFKGVSITPYASFLALESRRDGFTESGAGALNLDTDSERTSSLQGSLGVRLAKEFAIGPDLQLTPGISARWVHEFGDTSSNLNARFAGAPSGSFTVYSDTYDRDSGVFSLGLTGKAGDAWGFLLVYDAQVRSKEFAHAVTGGMKFNW
jgi:outer membrane autotransporter protein